MKHTKDIKTLFRNASIHTNPARDRAVLADALGTAGLAVGGRSTWRGARIGRITMKSPMTKLAIAAAVIVAVAIGIYALGSSKPAFADVVQPILNARTAVYKTVMRVQDGPDSVGETQFMAPAKVRYAGGFGNAAPAGLIQIVDYEQGKGLALIPSQKWAMVIELKNGPEQRQSGLFNTFAVLRDLIQKAQVNPDESVRYLGESQIQSRRVIGYEVTAKDATFGAGPGEKLTIWADAESLLPVQVEYSLDAIMGKPGMMTMTDIQFDVPLDPNQFSLAVPAGYTERTTQVDASPPTEANLVETLRIWTEATDGEFPAALNFAEAQQVFKALRDKGELQLAKETSLDGPEARKFGQLFGKISRGLNFVKNLPKETDPHYAGAGATFGDATKPIFWYRPQGSATYRVIYADLSIRDVALESLPK